ncbi:MAG: M67 family metallopeptidase [Eubacterium sp.]|nr:M67 family metallopeptidase [Eubacterium sp.]
MRKITIKKDDVNRIIEHAKNRLPDEACGLIGGIDNEDGVREIRKVYLLTNTDHSREHFSIDPKEQLQAVKDMRSEGIKPLGNWHSHPESPSRSSDEDIRLAVDSEASYLILSLMDIDNPVLNSFHVENGVSTREELVELDGIADRR